VLESILRYFLFSFNSFYSSEFPIGTVGLKLFERGHILSFYAKHYYYGSQGEWEGREEVGESPEASFINATSCLQLCVTEYLFG
jgi:hypothetical protein